MFRPSTFGIATMSARDTIAENLRTLMDAHHTLNSTLAIERATESAGSKVGKSTIDRVLKRETNLTLDNIDVIAGVFGLDAWQLMAPGLRPKNPPVLRSVGEAEDKLYQRMGELAKQIAELQPK